MSRLSVFALFLFALPALAANAPLLVNYQGVLRGAADEPLTGDFDMEFRFFDAESGGNEIMIDRHLAAGGQAVPVAGGMFSVALGDGQISDGSGPGAYTSIADLFRDHAGVWLEVQIGAETLAPRTRIQSAPYALNATNAVSAVSAGVAADASQLAGQPATFYLNTSALAQTKFGRVHFDNAAGVGFGVEATGSDGGGYFRDSNNSGYAYIGYGDYGMYGYGNTMGGYFQDLNNSGFSYVGYGEVGITSMGNDMGGYVRDLNNSGYSYIGYGDYGIQSFGNYTGGYFADLNESGLALVGFSGLGIRAYGNTAGGHFKDTNSTGEAYIAYQDDGIQAFGSLHGGYFAETGGSAFTRIAFGDFGIYGYGNLGGGFFDDRDSAGYAYTGYGAYKIFGTGTVSFVQNHPMRKDRTIVYAAPEGDEVAVYTRGSGLLTKGEARVALGETFALVANPDIGVTAHVTPRGDAHLWVQEVSPSEIVVRGPAGVDVAFDYIVYGLRIGFETLPVVQVKKDEAYLPTAATLAEYEAGQPDTVASSALVRYAAESLRLTGKPADLARADALAARINAGREQWLENRRNEDEQRRARIAATIGNPQGTPPAASVSRPSSTTDDSSAAATDPIGDEEPAARTRVHAGRQPASGETTDVEPPARVSTVFAAHSPIDTGDVVVIDRTAPGAVRRSGREEDRTVVGIAVGSAVDGWVEVAVGSVVEVRVDAGFGAIQPGDLLVSSPAPGTAMRAVTQEPGTILGKALDALESGLGRIRVLVMLR